MGHDIAWGRPCARQPPSSGSCRSSKQTACRYERDRPGELVHHQEQDAVRRQERHQASVDRPVLPNQNGKVERFHGTLRPDFLDQVEPFTSLGDAQAAVDAWVADYNAERPHQALDARLPVTPVDRFVPIPDEQRQLVELWLPPTFEAAPPAEAAPVVSAPGKGAPTGGEWSGGPVELDHVVPASGNM